MKDLILAHAGSMPSARLLREALVEQGFPKLLITRNPEKVIKFRYGNSAPSICNEILNPANFIKMTANKEIFSNFCNKIGVTAPVFSRLSTVLPDSLPVLVRSTLTGQGSEGIYPINNLDELSGIDTSWYWVPYYQLKKEYRVHVAGGRILKVFCKQFEGETTNGIVIRNNSNSHFSVVDTNKEGTFAKLKEVVKILNTELLERFKNSSLFFALDIGWGEKEREYIVLEANSAPGLNVNTANEYASVLGPILYNENR